ncbi:EG45-like domain containing protein [Senna tora]|uniref:EG45-like domain containing protein n=1 Tax=Senna tora TaxID=362788 RepID=A0A834U0W1_9FABA|nr:EG45-like domain containing protein [Senna tora]
MRHLLLALALFLSSLVLKQATIVAGDVGTAASYGPPYIPTACNGNRRDQFPPGNLFVAVSEGLWDNGAACGRRYRIRCVSGKNRPCKEASVDVKVVDFCANSPCPNTLLMSKDAFSAISRFHKSHINIEYTHFHLNENTGLNSRRKLKNSKTEMEATASAIKSHLLKGNPNQMKPSSDVPERQDWILIMKIEGIMSGWMFIQSTQDDQA